MVQRFTRVQTSEGGAMRKDVNGGFVLYSDYKTLQEENAMLREKIGSRGDWVPWCGGNCPVEDLIMLEAKFSNGDTMAGRACNFGWDHKTGFINLIAYRVLV